MTTPLFSKKSGEFKLEIFHDEPNSHNDPLSQDFCDRDNLFYLEGLLNDENFTEEEFDQFLSKNNNKFSSFYVCKVYRFGHSGVDFSASPFSCAFDSALTGFSYIPKKVFKGWSKEYKNLSFEKMREEFRRFTESQLKSYAQYLNGEIYCVEISKKNHEKFKWEQTDSCGGFYCKESIVEYARDYKFELTEDEITL